MVDGAEEYNAASLSSLFVSAQAYQGSLWTRRSNLWWRWITRLIIWAAVLITLVFGSIINLLLTQPATLVEVVPGPWVCLTALPPELQSLFNGSRTESFRIASAVARRPSDHLSVVTLGVHLQVFVKTQSRRELALNFSAVPVLKDPYNATLEELSQSSFSGWILVRDELARMRDEGHISPRRFEELHQHLKDVNKGRSRSI